jgi:hypothetical protein
VNRYKWDELDPFTQNEIELQPWDEGYGVNPPTMRTCGCEVMRSERWSLCRYHEGVQDGASEVRAEVVRLTGLLAVAGDGGVVCVVCGRVFGRRSGRGPVPRFCSAACRQRAHRARNAMRPPGEV